MLGAMDLQWWDPWGCKGLESLHCLLSLAFWASFLSSSDASQKGQGFTVWNDLSSKEGCKIPWSSSSANSGTEVGLPHSGSPWRLKVQALH